MPSAVFCTYAVVGDGEAKHSVVTGQLHFSVCGLRVAHNIANGFLRNAVSLGCDIGRNAFPIVALGREGDVQSVGFEQRVDVVGQQFVNLSILE